MPRLCTNLKGQRPWGLFLNCFPDCFRLPFVFALFLLLLGVVYQFMNMLAVLLSPPTTHWVNKIDGEQEAGRGGKEGR